MNYISYTVKGSKLTITWNETAKLTDKLYILFPFDIETTEMIIKSILFEIVIVIKFSNIEIGKNWIEIVDNNVNEISNELHVRLLDEYLKYYSKNKLTETESIEDNSDSLTNSNLKISKNIKDIFSSSSESYSESEEEDI
uniref:Uncharacterized protein n=1 Tax=Pithovirus LCDPAC02 TaxID=2506601 RepID=A0A481YP38_9VIRU|nr:MAG: hypothetical protein LCDPAC02_02820 [Pithovirus LCDPAC02]